LLTVNRLLIATGRSLDIITQAESIETFKNLRNDLTKLSYALYYAELTCHLGQGVSEETQLYFDMLLNALRRLSGQENNPAYLCLIFQLSFLDLLGLRPELDSCVICRKRLVEYNLCVFHHDLGGAICDQCFSNHVPEAGKRYKLKLAESHVFQAGYLDKKNNEQLSSSFTYLTPLVWKNLILAGSISLADNPSLRENIPSNLDLGQTDVIEKTIVAARHLLETYIEHRSGRKMKALSLI
jgi:DNA repair protein RecO